MFRSGSLAVAEGLGYAGPEVSDPEEPGIRLCAGSPIPSGGLRAVAVSRRPPLVAGSADPGTLACGTSPLWRTDAALDPKARAAENSKSN